jgi:HemY protein
MIRVLIVIALIGLAVFGFGWVADQPGDVAVTFRDKRYETSPIVALAAVIVVAALAALLFGFIGWLWRLPRRVRIAHRLRVREKGFTALSQGMVAAAAGDLRRAQASTREAAKRLGPQPLTMLLEAQTAILAGDRDETERAFARIAEHPESRVLGLRGLHAEARRRGDHDAAQSYALEANRIAPLPWAGQAVLEHHATRGDWKSALEAVDSNLSQKLTDKAQANRQRAVVRTAMAFDALNRDPEAALSLAVEAARLAPDLAPAVATAARLLGQRGDLRKASNLIETAWKAAPHPQLAEVYVSLRPGDSSADRLKRAESLARLAPGDPESRVIVARTAIGARKFTAARAALAPFLDPAAESRPTRRICALMAELEEAENGPSGRVREWLARASRAPRDKAWVADGIVADSWSAASPVSGKLDAWRWEAPPERLSQIDDEPLFDPSPEIEPAPMTRAPAIEVEARATPLAPPSPPDDPGPPRP